MVFPGQAWLPEPDLLGPPAAQTRCAYDSRLTSDYTNGIYQYWQAAVRHIDVSRVGANGRRLGASRTLVSYSSPIVAGAGAALSSYSDGARRTRSRHRSTGRSLTHWSLGSPEGSRQKSSATAIFEDSRLTVSTDGALARGRRVFVVT